MYGTYHQVATFFDEVGNLERIVNLDKFTVTKPVVDNGSVRLKTSVVATAFRFLEEHERPSVDEADGKKRKKDAVVAKRERRRAKNRENNSHCILYSPICAENSCNRFPIPDIL